MNAIENLKIKYPGSIVWSFGDSAEMADNLADLVIKGVKNATCCSLSSFKNEEESPTLGGYSIILNGKGDPVCVIRTIAMRVIRFCDVTDELAKKEGEGDLSLRYWKQGHKEFFQREGSYSDTMELVTEEFELVELL